MDDQMRALYTHKLNQEKAGKLGKGRKADQAPCLAVERLQSRAQFNERFGQGQTSKHGIGWVIRALKAKKLIALDKSKLQEIKLVGNTTNQFHSLKCQTSNSVASEQK